MFRNYIRSKSAFRLFINGLCRRQQYKRNHSAMLVAGTHNLALEKRTLPKENVRPVNKFVLRTHTCGELSTQNVGENVELCGWLEYMRNDKFLLLRDAYGSTQFVISDSRKDLQEIIQSLTFESVLSIEGKVVKRPENQVNKKMKTGDIEVIVESLEILNMAKSNMPFLIRSYNKAKESLRLKHRYISLRYPELQKYLRLRSKVIMKMREYLINECNFVDIETPTLFKNTPAGAQEFIVPTQIPGHFYSLVQSPQQFKQLLMVGGFDRYFQVARCYRDETPRHDRQPEFTQLDIEMSFVNCEGMMDLIENLLLYAWPEELEGISVPFKRMKYDEVMELYGIDKPDLRIPQQLRRLTEFIDYSILEETLKIKCEKNFEVYGLLFSQKHEYLTKNSKDIISDLQQNYYPSVKLIQIAVPSKSPKIKSIIEGNIQQVLNLEDGDVLFLACGEKFLTQSLLGKIRIQFTNILESKGEKVRSTSNELLWITDFPLFSFNSTTNMLESMHHPFTQPHPDDMQYLIENPLKLRALHYDLVMNGSEIAGGSIRIHDAKLQKQIFKMLHVNESHLTHMLDALESGAPPHGGIAIGLDRFMCLLCNTENIKNVIAFPKTISGRDLMSDAPTPIPEKETLLYHIKVINK